VKTDCEDASATLRLVNLFSQALGVGDFSWLQVGNDVYLEFSVTAAVPEPATRGIVVIGLMGIGAGRRVRRGRRGRRRV